MRALLNFFGFVLVIAYSAVLVYIVGLALDWLFDLDGWWRYLVSTVVSMIASMNVLLSLGLLGLCCWYLIEEAQVAWPLALLFCFPFLFGAFVAGGIDFIRSRFNL